VPRLELLACRVGVNERRRDGAVPYRHSRYGTANLYFVAEAPIALTADDDAQQTGPRVDEVACHVSRLVRAVANDFGIPVRPALCASPV
jgi:hypothetical protein